MNAFKNSLIISLSLIVIGFGYVTGNQSKQIAELLEGRHRVLDDPQEQPSSPAHNPTDLRQIPPTPAHNPDTRIKHNGSPANIDLKRKESVQAVKDSTEYKRLADIVTRGTVSDEFAGLFAKLDLGPAAASSLEALLLEKQLTGQDVLAVAHAQGIPLSGNESVISKLINDNNALVDETIRTQFGNEVFETYQAYQQTKSIRLLTNNLRNRLIYSTTPLNAQQQEQMIDLIAQSPEQTGQSRGFGLLTATSMSRVRSLLTPEQYGALERLQIEQQAKMEMQELLIHASKPIKIPED